MARIPTLVASGAHLTALERICEALAAALDARRLVAPGAGHFVAAAPGFLDRASGRAIGSTRYLALLREHRSLEIGWTWLGRPYWRTGVNVETKLLLLTRAFEVLGCERVELKTDVRNIRSRKATEALPALFEGIHRRHMALPDGTWRDTAWYSVIAPEWPKVRANLRRRLAEHGVDGYGGGR
jgi:RimJ/RimL family protein N-acetyltransferase